MNDNFFMKKVLNLAKKGTGKVSPNPRVGALIVKNGKILAEGYHACYGEAHAETAALNKLSHEQTEGSTLFVNLEPCVHYGKTPPCTEYIIKYGIRRVVIGVIDQNPVVKGKGIQKLSNAGIEICQGILENECFQLNEAYFKYITQKKPFITLKIAQTLDGKIATTKSSSRWITSELSRRFVHKMRKENDAILIGVNTVIKDNPELTVRMVPGNVRVKRVILDPRLRIPLDAKVLNHPDPQNSIIVITQQAPLDKIEIIKKKGITIWTFEANSNGKIKFSELWKRMTDEGICSVLVEGGKEVFTSVIQTGDVDRMVVFIAPKLFGHGIEPFGELGINHPEEAITFKKLGWNRKGQDIIFEGRF